MSWGGSNVSLTLFLLFSFVVFVHWPTDESSREVRKKCWVKFDFVFTCYVSLHLPRIFSFFPFHFGRLANALYWLCICAFYCIVLLLLDSFFFDPAISINATRELCTLRTPTQHIFSGWMDTSRFLCFRSIFFFCETFAFFSFIMISRFFFLSFFCCFQYEFALIPRRIFWCRVSLVSVSYIFSILFHTTDRNVPTIITGPQIYFWWRIDVKAHKSDENFRVKKYFVYARETQKSNCWFSSDDELKSIGQQEIFCWDFSRLFRLFVVSVNDRFEKSMFCFQYFLNGFFYFFLMWEF